MVDAIDAYDGLSNSLVEDVKSSHEGLPAELHAAYAKFKGTSKNIGPIAITEGGTKEWDYLAKMAAEVQGGFDGFRKRPIIGCLPTAIGPLETTRQNFWAIVGGAKYHIPSFPYWGGTAPFTAPATPASQIALSLACTHYGIAVSQYLSPGTAAIPWVICTPVDPHSGQLTQSPMFLLTHGIGNQVYQDLYELATFGCAHALNGSLEEVATGWMANLLLLTLQGLNYIQFRAPPNALM